MKDVNKMPGRYGKTALGLRRDGDNRTDGYGVGKSLPSLGDQAVWNSR